MTIKRQPMLDLGVNKQQSFFFLNHHNHHPQRPSTTPPIVAASRLPTTTSTRLYDIRTTQKRHVSSRQGNEREHTRSMGGDDDDVARPLTCRFV
jgi:hypothetical protein